MLNCPHGLALVGDRPYIHTLTIALALDLTLDSLA